MLLLRVLSLACSSWLALLMVLSVRASRLALSERVLPALLCCGDFPLSLVSFFCCPVFSSSTSFTKIQHFSLKYPFFFFKMTLAKSHVGKYKCKGSIWDWKDPGHTRVLWSYQTGERMTSDVAAATKMFLEASGIWTAGRIFAGYNYERVFQRSPAWNLNFLFQ